MDEPNNSHIVTPPHRSNDSLQTDAPNTDSSLLSTSGTSIQPLDAVTETFANTDLSNTVNMKSEKGQEADTALRKQEEIEHSSSGHTTSHGLQPGTFSMRVDANLPTADGLHQGSGSIVAESLQEQPGISAAEGAAAASTPTKSLGTSAYHIKWIKWKGQKTPIITQNENGPCPLIAIMNVLILKGRISLPAVMEIITTEQLMEYLGDAILDSVPKNIPEGAQLNYEQNMHDAIAVLPKLQTGLDVNVRFTSVNDFEYTPECIVFDLLHIPLYHGWLMDPQQPEIQAAIGKCSYNQLVDKIISNKCSSRTEVVTEALLAENFLEKTASQLTYHGLCELISVLKDEQLCVLFRNNHFITLYKHKNELFQLVTDQGFLTECTVVWETLNNVEGDGQFVDSEFLTVPPKSGSATLPPNITTEQQIDQDFLVALTLQDEQQKQQEQEKAWEEYKQKNLGVSESVADEELARRLQDEENRHASNAVLSGHGSPRHRGPPGASAGSLQPVPAGAGSSRSRNRDCKIL